jgi:hypothetical protein
LIVLVTNEPTKQVGELIPSVDTVRPALQIGGVGEMR